MSAQKSRVRSAIKFLFWTATAAALFTHAGMLHSNGQLAAWYYHRAAADGYAINADLFADATKDHPAVLTISQVDKIESLVAVPVKKGDLMPRNANGIIDDQILKAGKRAVVEGGTLKVSVPWQMQDAKGFKFKDTFKHKGVETNPWAAVWNVLMVIFLGLALGLMAEGFTDLLGMRVEKIRHFEGH